MNQKLTKTGSVAQRCSTMETGDHLKNGVSLRKRKIFSIRALLFILSCFCLSGAFSQKEKYEGHFEVGNLIQAGVNMWGKTQITQPINASNIVVYNGCRFNKYFFLGLGVGAEYSFWKEETLRFVRNNNYTDKYYSWHIPVSLRFKSNFMDTRVSPYLIFEAGYNLLIKNPSNTSRDNLYKRNGVIINPSIGFDVSITEKVGLFFHAGYHAHINTTLRAEQTHNKTRHSVSLKIGVNLQSASIARAELEREKIALESNAETERIRDEEAKREAELNAVEAAKRETERKAAEAAKQEAERKVAEERNKAIQKVNTTKINEYTLNETALSQSQKSELNGVADVLNKYSDVKVLIIGHTCDISSQDINLKVGLKRAEAGKEYLIEKGIVSERISVDSKGKTQPLVPNTSSENRKQNRRIEFVVE